MKRNTMFKSLLALVLVLALGSGTMLARQTLAQGSLGITGAASTLSASLGAGFTYQGRLSDASGPVDGTCDLTFKLYDEAGTGTPPTGGTLLGTVTKLGEEVSDGYFTVQLDFGDSAFTGDARWLEIAVDCGSGATTLSPRQALTAAPYALHSLSTGALQDYPVADTAPATNQVLKWNGSDWAPALDETGAGGSYWSLTGNAGTMPGIHFLGTTDEVSLTLAVNGSAALRLGPHATSPNFIGGHANNIIAAGAYGATIGGGGNITSPHHVTGNYGTVGGGLGNWVLLPGSPSDTLYGTVGGGYNNGAHGEGATVSGGYGNMAVGYYAAVPGGDRNSAMGDYSFAAGRRANANYDGSFVWADSTNAEFYSDGADKFSVRATGGVNFQTGSADFQINDRNVWQPANVIMVAQSGGDYTSVQAAIDSIGDAAAGNPYLVWVAPGVYNEIVTMKAHVHLQGAGQEATIIASSATTGDWPPTTATLLLADHVSLRDLTVENSGTGYRNVALLATDGTTQTLVADVTMRAQGTGGTGNFAVFLTGSGASVTLLHVTALAENADNNYGLYNRDGVAVRLHGGSFTARGGDLSRGIYNKGSGTMLQAESVTALAENGANNNYGLYSASSAAATLHDGSFTARGGSSVYGIYNSNTLEAEGVTALAEDGANNNHGLYNIGGAATLRGGSFIARGGSNARGIYNAGSNATLETESVTALAENGTDNYGLYNISGAAATPRGGSFTGRGGSNAYGICNSGSSTTLDTESVTALGEDGTSNNYGLYNASGASATPRGGSFTARGGIYARGIYNDDASTALEAESVTSLAEDGTSSNYGLYNASSAAAILRDGSFTGRGGDTAYGIYNDGASTTLEAEGIAALGENGGSYNYGLYNFYGAVTLRGGSFTAREGTYSRGIVNYGSGATLEAEHVSLLAENGFANNYGLYNPSGTATLRGGSCIGRGGVACGIYNIGSGATLKAESLTALGENGGTNYGLRITAGTATVTQGVLEGVTYSVVHNGGAITVSNSRLVGGAVSGSVTCVAVSRGATWSQNTCP